MNGTERIRGISKAVRERAASLRHRSPGAGRGRFPGKVSIGRKRRLMTKLNSTFRIDQHLPQWNAVDSMPASPPEIIEAVCPEFPSIHSDWKCFASMICCESVLR
jgi:hypothetical protein